MSLRKIFLTAVTLLVFFTSPLFTYGQETTADTPRLIFFYSATCHVCSEIKSIVMPQIEKKFYGRIGVDYRDILDVENYKLLLGLQEKWGVKLKNIVPIIYFEGKFLTGKKQVKERLSRLITESLSQRAPPKQILPAVDLIGRFRAFKPIAIVSAGLIDGVNPCAFTVIIFFMSFLALQGYMKRQLVAIGLSFIVSVFITYLLIGLGAFGFLYRLNKFWLVTKILNYSIGVFSIVLGCLALYDFFKFKKTGETEGLILQLPKAIKSQIHKVVGTNYRVEKNLESAAPGRPLFKLVISAFITGFLVSLLEAVCTGQMYLPTITFILKTTPFKLDALGYLTLYNLMFIVPLLVVFLLALFGVSSEQFSKFLKGHLSVIKMLMALSFFGLGAFLIWRG